VYVSCVYLLRTVVGWVCRVAYNSIDVYETECFSAKRKKYTTDSTNNEQKYNVMLDVSG
jgi:hypothetical protein